MTLVKTGRWARGAVMGILPRWCELKLYFGFFLSLCFPLSQMLRGGANELGPRNSSAHFHEASHDSQETHQWG
jgi:hypothetical protein